MADPKLEELQNRKERSDAQNQQEQDRIQAAIDARRHANEYQQDSAEANRAADEAEAAIDNPPQ